MIGKIVSLAIGNLERCIRLRLEKLALPLLLVTTVQAKTLLNPLPENSSTLFGRAIAVIDDLDGDRVPDLAVGAPFQDGDFVGPPGFDPPKNVGKVFIISGRTLHVITQLNDPEFEMIQPQKFGGQLGRSIAATGDINGDGIPDILVGDPHHITEGEEEKEINAGRAFVFSGKDGAVLITLDDPIAEEDGKFGSAVAGLTDVNGDGIPDLLAGAPGKPSPSGATEAGVAYIFSGKNGKLIRSLDPPAQAGVKSGARFGAAVANAGDINHDGVADILIGTPGRSRAYAFDGATGALVFTILSPVVETQPSFGFAVAGGKDLDGDGVPDLVIGAPLFDNLRGRVFIFSGKNGARQGTLHSPANQPFSRFGASISLSRNISGKPAILIGAPDQNVKGLLNAGAVFVFRGGGSLLNRLTSTAPQAFAGFGFSLAAADFNRDGIEEPVIGVPFQDADVVASDGDIETHLQTGQIEIKQ